METTEIEQVRFYISLYEAQASALPRRTVAQLKVIRAAELHRRHVKKQPGPVPEKKAELVTDIIKMQYPYITEARARLAELEA